MSIVEYQAREANVKGKKSAEGKSVTKNVEVQASVAGFHAGQATPGGRENMCPVGSKSGEILLKKSTKEDSNHKNSMKQTAAKENSEVLADCSERVSCCKEAQKEEEGESEAKVKMLLAELMELGKEMEEEKDKSRRLQEENEKLDIELELIEERLK